MTAIQSIRLVVLTSAVAACNASGGGEAAPAPSPAVAPPAAAPAPAPTPAPAGSPTARKVPVAPDQPVVDIIVDASGYNPPVVTVEKGKPTRFRVKRVFERTCADGIRVPAAGIDEALPLGKTVEFALAVDADTPFGCPMGMMIAGKIAVR
ncbi:MAG: cupredoxin domain-containing protein [Myxococcota bacterium]